VQIETDDRRVVCLLITGNSFSDDYATHDGTPANILSAKAGALIKALKRAVEAKGDTRDD